MTKDYAALLAQVIPVVALALGLELRSIAERAAKARAARAAWRRESAPSVDQPASSEGLAGPDYQDLRNRLHNLLLEQEQHASEYDEGFRSVFVLTVGGLGAVAGLLLAVGEIAALKTVQGAQAGTWSGLLHPWQGFLAVAVAAVFVLPAWDVLRVGLAGTSRRLRRYFLFPVLIGVPLLALGIALIG